MTSPRRPKASAWHAPSDAPSAPTRPPSPVPAADPELTRVRVLLAALRPDAADPFEPLPARDGPVSIILPRSPSPDLSTGGGIPRGMFIPPAVAEELARTRAADVLRELAALPPDAAAVLRWLRLHASLTSGLRGLYVDVGAAFASAEQAARWRDLTARRDGAPAHGRRLVLAAATAWGR